MSDTYGYCQCGCGQKTRLATRTRPSRAMVKGEPIRFINGHNGRNTTPEYIVEHDTGCWIWQRFVGPDGYGNITDRSGPKPRTLLAHRVYYEREHGQIPEGLQIDHLCRNRACVNPSPNHLEAVTPAENSRRGSGTKLSGERVEAIRNLWAVGVPQPTIARRFGISQPHVSRIVTFDVWREAA